MSTIIDTGNVAEIQDLGPDDEISNMDATSEPTGRPMEFHVQMRGHTFSDMQDLIVHAAAQQLITGFNGPDGLRRLIEAKCIELVSAKADAALAIVTAEIIDQPLTPSFGDKKPVTMREFIGLTGREYLTERVDREGKPSKAGWGEATFTRAELLVIKNMEQKFKKELQEASYAAVREIQTQIKAAHESLLAEHKAQLRDALAKATGAV